MASSVFSSLGLPTRIPEPHFPLNGGHHQKREGRSKGGERRKERERGMEGGRGYPS
jgi:hypothetical protein